jgi:hypothetical protein
MWRIHVAHPCGASMWRIHVAHLYGPGSFPVPKAKSFNEFKCPLRYGPLSLQAVTLKIKQPVLYLDAIHTHFIDINIFERFGAKSCHSTF